MEKYFIFLWNRITVVTIIAQSESALGKDVRTSEAARVRLKKHQKNTPPLIEFLENINKQCNAIFRSCARILSAISDEDGIDDLFYT